MTKIRNLGAFACAALLLFIACGCAKEAPGRVPDYRERGSKSLLLRPYQETVAELEPMLGKRSGRITPERTRARRTLEELIWLHYDDSDFFVFLSGSGNNEVVEEGIDNLRRFPDTAKVREALCRLTGADSDRIRDEALFYLSQVKEEEFRQRTLMSHIDRALKDRSEAVRYRAVMAMRGLDRGEVGKLLECISEDRAPSVRGESLRVIAFTGDRAAAPLILKGLRDPSPFVRVCALEACGILRLSDAISQIAAHLEDSRCSFYSVPYDDGTMCSFNTEESTVQDAALKALEVIYNKKFDTVEACKRWYTVKKHHRMVTKIAENQSCR